MGAEQSSTRGSASQDDAPKKTDYYELLGVDRQATDDEYGLRRPTARGL